MKRTLELIGLLLIAAMTASAQPSAGINDMNLDDEKIALQGFDPVAYFKDKRAVEGKPSISLNHEGVTYHFSSQVNRDLFARSPVSYMPQYGGWCAYAMGAKGEKVDVNPETFKIVDGKLYLFYNRFFNNTLETWNKDEAKLKANADKNWRKLIHEKH